MKRTTTRRISQIHNFPLTTFILTLATLASLSASAQTSSKLGYANADYIFSQLPDAKQVEATLKATSEQLNNMINAKDLEWKKKFTDYTANQNNMLEAVRNNTLNEIEQLQENVNKFKQEAQAELQRKEQQLLQPVYQKILKAIADVAKENGYTVILSQRVSGTPTLLHAGEEDNISDMVLKKLGITPQPSATKN